MSSSSKKSIAWSVKRADALLKEKGGAASMRAAKFRRCRSRKPPEEATGQAATIVDDDGCDAPAGDADLIWNHCWQYISRKGRSARAFT
jgi:hypothetical protein